MCQRTAHVCKVNGTRVVQSLRCTAVNRESLEGKCARTVFIHELRNIGKRTSERSEPVSFFDTNGHTLGFCPYIESKVRKLSITQGLTLGVKGLTNSTTVKYCSTAFQ